MLAARKLINVIDDGTVKLKFRHTFLLVSANPSTFKWHDKYCAEFRRMSSGIEGRKCGQTYFNNAFVHPSEVRHKEETIHSVRCCLRTLLKSCALIITSFFVAIKRRALYFTITHTFQYHFFDTATCRRYHFRSIFQNTVFH